MRRLFSRRTDASLAHAQPAHIEIWGHFISVNRLLKRMIVTLTAICAVSVAGALWLALIALHRPVVYMVDPDGRASYGGRLGEASHPQKVEIAYVAKQFVRHMLAFNSLSIESDLAEAFNLMTEDLRRRQAAELDAYEAERGYGFVDFVKRQHIRTTLDVARTEIRAHKDAAWTVQLSGIARTWPLSRDGEPAVARERRFESTLSLVRVPRTELCPNGLLVAQQTAAFFELPHEADALEQIVSTRKSPASAPGPDADRSPAQPKPKR